MDKPLHVIYEVSKLAYRIWVILIANKRVKKIRVGDCVGLDIVEKRKSVISAGIEA
jgi:hypothetical protein